MDGWWDIEVRSAAPVSAAAKSIVRQRCAEFLSGNWHYFSKATLQVHIEPGGCYAHLFADADVFHAASEGETVRACERSLERLKLQLMRKVELRVRLVDERESAVA